MSSSWLFSSGDSEVKEATCLSGQAAAEGAQIALLGNNNFSEEVRSSLQESERKSAAKASKWPAGSLDRLAEELEGLLHVKAQEALIAQCEVSLCTETAVCAQWIHCVYKRDMAMIPGAMQGCLQGARQNSVGQNQAIFR